MSRFKTAVFALALGSTLVLGQSRAATLSDIPGGHWSKQAASELVDKGFMALFEDGTFRGDVALSRYAFVSAMAKLLAEMDKLKAAPGGGGGSDTAELKQLLTQVKTALGQLETAQQQLGVSSQKTGESQEVLERDVTKLMDNTNTRMKKLEGNLADMADDMRERDARLKAEITALNESLTRAEKKNARSRSMLWLGVVAAAAVGVATGN